MFGNVFNGGKTVIEWKCKFDEFLEVDHHNHEVNIWIREIFGSEMVEEIKHEILKIFQELSENLERNVIKKRN